MNRWLLFIAVVAAAGSCKQGGDTPATSNTDRETPSTPAVAAPPVQVPIATPSPLETLLSITSLSEAIENVKPRMSDTDDETSPGAIELAIWAVNHLRWTDVAVAKNETSFALVHKDPYASRGKRMCVRGTIIQIQKEKVGSSSVFSGLLLSGYTEIVSYIAAGSTGELVKESAARLCGVVIGTYDYSNSGGGKGHAVSIVGMFDRPENRKAR